MAEGQQQKHRQACDTCRCRKIKCDRGSPCGNCASVSLECRYLHVRRRTGPKRGCGRRLSQLRLGTTQIDRKFVNIEIPENPPRLTNSFFPKTVDRKLGDQTERSHFCSPPAQALDNNADNATTLSGNSVSIPSNSLIEEDNRFQLLSSSLAAHVQVFLEYMFPIMPVIDGEVLLADTLRLGELHPSRYALVVSLCAATRAHLRLDNIENNSGGKPGASIPSEPRLTAEMLAMMAETALRQYNAIDDLSTDTTLASFFLFATYGNFDNAHHAWFYLNQSITLAQALDLTCEASYTYLPEHEGEARRRIFWLLFVTERTFALQHRRSVMLRSRIAKPRMIASDCPTVVMHDFLNHISVFEILPCSLYEWNPESDGQKGDCISLTDDIQTKLCDIRPESSLIESQRFDTLITQQWLRVSMWRLELGKMTRSLRNQGSPMISSVPFEAGKVVMKALGSFDQTSRDCNGIGIEQKLFDIGVGLVDSAVSTASSLSSWEVGPRDLLQAIIKALSKVRGCQSHLLPSLCKHSKEAFGCQDPIGHIGMPWAFSEISTVFEADPSHVVEEDITPQAEGFTDLINWELIDDFRIEVPNA